LKENNILSAPVIENKKFIGFVDVLDIVGLTLATYRENLSLFFENSAKAKFVESEFFKKPVTAALNFSEVDTTVCVSDALSVYDVVKVFIDPRRRNRLHRVAVVNYDEPQHPSIVNVLSQSDLIALAVANLHLFPDSLISQPLSSLGVIHGTLMCRIDSPFVDTLEVLYRNRVSGVALVDQDGHISGNLSASDLRGLSAKSFQYFNTSTMLFMVKGTKSDFGPPISVGYDTSLGDALKKLREYKIHRLFVADTSEHIQGMISLGDLIHLLA